MSRPWVVVSVLLASVAAAMASLVITPPSFAHACFITFPPPEGEWVTGPCVSEQVNSRYGNFFAWERLDQSVELMVGAALVTLFAVSTPKELWYELGQAFYRALRYMTPGTVIQTRD